MAWKIELQRDAQKDIAKLGHDNARRILRFLHGRLALLDDPRSIGEALKGPELQEFWKYRVGDYRIIADIEDGVLRILVVRVGHRSSIYR